MSGDHGNDTRGLVVDARVARVTQKLHEREGPSKAVHAVPCSFPECDSEQEAYQEFAIVINIKTAQRRISVAGI